MIAHRKQGPVLPTLTICISPDPATDKLRKRRSSRTAGLTTTKETSPTTLWFRPSDDGHTLHDWARFIQPLIQPRLPDRHPLSPSSPAVPTFTNPFTAITREAAEHFYNSVAGKNGPPRNGSSHRERPLTYSESHSLRSRRSDLSHSSSMQPPHGLFAVHGQGNPGGHSSDLPSPATTIGEYHGDFIEGWTAAQGRSSAVSSPVRSHDSMGSPPGPPPLPTNHSSPPGHRETILDRAFNLRYIPGSESDLGGDEHLSSIARFEALMKQAEEKRKRMGDNPRGQPPRSGWDLDSDDEVDDEDRLGLGRSELDERTIIPPSTQRALEFIANRHEPLPVSRAPDSRAALYLADESSNGTKGSANPRPKTGYSRNRPNMGHRTHSQPHLLAAAAEPVPPVPTVTKHAYAEENTQQTSRAEKRLSTSSTKRLSFTEWTKRLSSTSSLLLVQTNQSGSNRGSSEIDVQNRAAANARGMPPPPTNDKEREAWEKRCGWRGSVGVFGSEGGFL